MPDHVRAGEEVGVDTTVYQDAEGFVRAGLTWLAEHYERSGSSRYRALPSPQRFFDLIVQVGKALRSFDDDISRGHTSRGTDPTTSTLLGPEVASSVPVEETP